jgi:hypothetical protein
VRGQALFKTEFIRLLDCSFDKAIELSETASRKERPQVCVFSPKEVWDGLEREDGTWLCNGLIRDWASWQKE